MPGDAGSTRLSILRRILSRGRRPPRFQAAVIGWGLAPWRCCSPASRASSNEITPMADAILVLNAGSSSLKFSVFLDGEPPQPLLRGQIEGLLTEPHFKARNATGM